MESGQKEEGLSSSEVNVEIKKCCSDCRTTKTPLWRSGPSGPKSLCNACGIRYRKNRPTPSAAAAKSDWKKGKIGKTRILNIRNALKENVLPLGEELEAMEGQRSRLKNHVSLRQWGEVERAALLLMALSRGVVFA